MFKANKSAFKPPGFTFGEGQIFQSHQTTENVYHAMIGVNASNSDVDLTTLKQRVSSRVEKLFEVGLKQIDVYRATSGGAQFFKMIAEEFEAETPLEPKEIDEIFGVYIVARERYRGSVGDAPLMALVDRFREAMELLSAFDNLQLSEDAPDPSSSSSAEAPWPLTYFNLHEKIWLCDSRIRWQLYGKGQVQPSDASDIPTLPDRYSHPVDVKLYPAWPALTNYSPTLSDGAFYMSPIGSSTPRIARTGTSPRVKAFTSTRSVVAGFFTFWTAGDPESFEKLYASKGENKRRDLF
ncbi:hypothetical protein DL764_010483 [Monosporascus ibericus]|uniref:Uncharacterized protein n=1 Tax=Monosporascus ibericus TaxID=155417 RepID=A0A4Q4SSK1_9PEZI|nr:hypothetical protein DL764_010483 [Monosporascus ibericus]